MTTLLLWLLVAVALAFVVSGVTMLFIARLARRRLPEAMEAAARAGRETLRVAPMAQYYGVASAGRRQLRGNGSLILTAEHLRFDMWSPQRDVVIPLAEIVQVDTTHRHAGKHSARPLLRVAWRTWDGLEDSAAWALNDPDGWQSRLAETLDAARARGDIGSQNG